MSRTHPPTHPPNPPTPRTHRKDVHVARRLAVRAEAAEVGEGAAGRGRDGQPHPGLLIVLAAHGGGGGGRVGWGGVGASSQNWLHMGRGRVGEGGVGLGGWVPPHCTGCAWGGRGREGGWVGEGHSTGWLCGCWGRGGWPAGARGRGGRCPEHKLACTRAPPLHTHARPPPPTPTHLSMCNHMTNWPPPHSHPPTRTHPLPTPPLPPPTPPTTPTHLSMCIHMTNWPVALQKSTFGRSSTRLRARSGWAPALSISPARWVGGCGGVGVGGCAWGGGWVGGGLGGGWWVGGGLSGGWLGGRWVGWGVVGWVGGLVERGGQPLRSHGWVWVGGWVVGGWVGGRPGGKGGGSSCAGQKGQHTPGRGSSERGCRCAPPARPPNARRPHRLALTLVAPGVEVW